MGARGKVCAMGLESRILAATGNPAKLVEIRRIMAGLPFEVVGFDALDGYVAPVEDGGTYLENARIKATHAARFSGLTCFADDSGLEVDAIGGAPGILSARFDGDLGTPESRNCKLLSLLSHVPLQERGARFKAVVVLVVPDGAGGFEEHSFEGVLEGRIASRPSGRGGFGYDPVFEVPHLGLTVAEMSASDKDRISHRGQAIRAMAARLSKHFEPRWDR